MKMVTVETRWMINRDMPEVLKIEQESFPDPWTEADFQLVLRDRHNIGLVAEIGVHVVGFVVYQLGSRSLRILGLAVDPRFRRQKIGQAIVTKLKAKLGRKKGRTRIVFEIADVNLPGQLFFRSQDFRATKVLRHYFDLPDGSKCDAYRMEYHLNEKEGE